MKVSACKQLLVSLTLAVVEAWSHPCSPLTFLFLLSPTSLVCDRVLALSKADFPTERRQKKILRATDCYTEWKELLFNKKRVSRRHLRNGCLPGKCIASVKAARSSKLGGRANASRGPLAAVSDRLLISLTLNSAHLRNKHLLTSVPIACGIKEKMDRKGYTNHYY